MLNRKAGGANHTIRDSSGNEIELNVSPRLMPSVVRTFMGRTPLDTEIDVLSIPVAPYWLNRSVAFLRWYRRKRPARIGNRCVFDPSCSRYAEMAFREHGFWKSVPMIIARLNRCRTGAGGLDYLQRQEESPDEVPD